MSGKVPSQVVVSAELFEAESAPVEGAAVGRPRVGAQTAALPVLLWAERARVRRHLLVVDAASRESVC